MSVPRTLLIPNIFLMLAIAVLGCLSLHLFGRWQAALQYPFQMDASEGFILEQATAIARGQSIYGPIDRPPFLVGNYPPLFQTFYAAFVGPKASLWSLVHGRILTIVATLICALLLAAIAAWITRRALPAILAPFLFLVTYEVYLWSPLVRVDFPALALTLSGLLVFIVSNRRWSLALSGLLFTAAFYTRQTAILAPLACALALALHDRRRLPWFIGPAAVVALIVLLILQKASGGEYFRHTVSYNQNRMDWGVLWLLLKNEIWFFHCWLIVAAIVAAASGLVFLRSPAIEPQKKPALSALRFYAALAAISLLSYAKIGAGVNYVLEPLAATVGLLAVTTGLLMRDNHRFGRWAASTFIGAILLTHSLWLIHRNVELFSAPNPAGLEKTRASGLAQYLRGVNGDILCEEPMFTMLAGRPVLFDPFIMSRLAKESKWDQSNFIRMIDRRRFARIVSNEDLMTPQTDYERYTPRMAAAVRAHYKPVGNLQLPRLQRRYFIYEPAREKP